MDYNRFLSRTERDWYFINVGSRTPKLQKLLVFELDGGMEADGQRQCWLPANTYVPGSQLGPGILVRRVTGQRAGMRKGSRRSEFPTLVQPDAPTHESDAKLASQLAPIGGTMARLGLKSTVYQPIMDCLVVSATRRDLSRNPSKIERFTKNEVGVVDLANVWWSIE